MLDLLVTTELHDKALAAMKQLPRVLDGRKEKVTEADIDSELWRSPSGLQSAIATGRSLVNSSPFHAISRCQDS